MRIDVSASLQPSVQITDTGTGIAPEQLTRITERFYRAEQKHEGFGIGLSIVQPHLPIAPSDTEHYHPRRWTNGFVRAHLISTRYFTRHLNTVDRARHLRKPVIMPQGCFHPKKDHTTHRGHYVYLADCCGNIAHRRVAHRNVLPAHVGVGVHFRLVCNVDGCGIFNASRGFFYQ